MKKNQITWIKTHYLKKLRIEKDYSNNEHIAFEFSMSRSAYWYLESGKNFEIKTLIKICKLFRITLFEFLSQLICEKKKKRWIY